LRDTVKAAVAAILSFGGVGLAPDALAWGHFDGKHFGHGKRIATNHRIMTDENPSESLPQSVGAPS
jgi:hypothetical protein